MGSSRTRARTCVLCIGRWILNHCATREVPPQNFFEEKRSPNHQVSNLAFSIYPSLFHMFHNQLPSSVDSTCVICPTPFCISTALFQFFIILDLWCDPGILTGLPTSCLFYPQPIVYTAAGQLPFFQASETCLQQRSPCTTAQDLYNFTWSCRSFLSSCCPLYTLYAPNQTSCLATAPDGVPWEADSEAEVSGQNVY